MRFNVEYERGAAVVGVEGDIDMACSRTLREALLEVINEPDQDVVIVNLHGVEYMDSSGIASLVEGLQMAARRNVRYFLTGLNAGPLHVLRLTRLIDAFEVRDSVADALKG